MSTSVNTVVVYRKRRTIELVMLLFALALGYGGYLITHLNIDDRVPSDWMPVAGVWLGLGLVVHVFVRWRLPYADPLIVPCVFLLNGLGLAMIDRIDQIPTPVRHDATIQLLWTALGCVCFIGVVLLVRDYRVLRRFPFTAFLVGLVLLLLPLVPGLGYGGSEWGSQIWIRIAGYSFQPAEVAKIVLAVAFASYLVEKKDLLALAGARFLGIDLPRPRDLGPIVLMWAASLAVLVFQRDLGTSLLFFGLFVIMLYVATERPSWAILGALLFAGGAWAGFTLFRHVRVRAEAWLHPFDNYEQNLQVISAQFGIAWGGLFGRGWGLGRPGLTPLAKSDFIAAALGEELGIAGLMAIIVVYAILVSRGLRTALSSSDPFGKLLATGLSFVFALQVFAIVGGVTRLLPLTGLTTPFMSQGGSSMIANWVIIALMMLISHQVRRPSIPSTVPADDADALAADTTQLIAVRDQGNAAAPVGGGQRRVSAASRERGRG